MAHKQPQEEERQAIMTIWTQETISTKPSNNENRKNQLHRKQNQNSQEVQTEQTRHPCTSKPSRQPQKDNENQTQQQHSAPDTHDEHDRDAYRNTAQILPKCIYGELKQQNTRQHIQNIHPTALPRQPNQPPSPVADNNNINDTIGKEEKNNG